MILYCFLFPTSLYHPKPAYIHRTGDAPFFELFKMESVLLTPKTSKKWNTSRKFKFSDFLLRKDQISF